MTHQRFRALLKRLELTQRALARDLGVHAVTVNLWCSGKLSVPQYAVAYLQLLHRLRQLERAAAD